MLNVIKSHPLDINARNAEKLLNRTLFFFLLLTQICFAQWVQTNGLDGKNRDYFSSFAISGNNLFVGTLQGDVLLSTNNGTFWTKVSSGLSTYQNVSSLAVKETNIFAGISGSLITFLSTDFGATWTADINESNNKYVVRGENIYEVFWYSSVFLSTNNGASWISASNGLPLKANVSSFIVSGSNLYVGTLGEGIFLSTNNGTSWTAVNSGLTNMFVPSFAVSGMDLFAGTLGGVFLSTNNGTSWTKVNSGLTNMFVPSLAVIGTNLFAGTFGGGVFLSTNNGTSWTEVNNGLTSNIVYSLAISGTNLFAGTIDGGVFLSTNNGTSWTAVNSGLHPKTTVKSLAVSSTNLFAGTAYSMWRRPLKEMTTSMGSEEPLLIEFSLSQNYPNPFNSSTVIGYQLPVSGVVSLKVYDILGREVTTLVNEQKVAGRYEVNFDASHLASGVYIYKLKTENYKSSKKMILVK